MLKTALIVDDSRLARLTLRRLLVKHNLEIFEAEGVVDAEEWLQRNTLPDVVFMDILMPKLDGYEGLKRMRENPETRNIPVVMYSGDISEEARQKARDAGATGYLPKPAEAGRLDHLINALNQKVAAKPEPVVAPTEISVPSFNSFSPAEPGKPAQASALENFNFSSSMNLGSTGPEPSLAPEPTPAAAPENRLSSFATLANNVSDDIPTPSLAPRPLPETTMSFETSEGNPSATSAPAPAAVDSEALKALEKRLAALEEALKQVPSAGAADSRVEQLEEKLQQRLNDLEFRLNALERKPVSDGAATERLHRDIVFLNRQVSDVEKKSRVNLALAIIAGILALLGVVWQLLV